MLLAATTEAGKNKKGEGQRGAGGMGGTLGRAPMSLQRAPTLPPPIEKVKKDVSKCEDWRWGPCVPNSKDCGLGYREGTCKDESKKLKCKIPCNWKKKFGGGCVGPPWACSHQVLFGSDTSLLSSSRLQVQV